MPCKKKIKFLLLGTCKLLFFFFLCVIWYHWYNRSGSCLFLFLFNLFVFYNLIEWTIALIQKKWMSNFCFSYFDDLCDANVARNTTTNWLGFKLFNYWFVNNYYNSITISYEAQTPLGLDVS
jgi:hypothetical protein